MHSVEQLQAHIQDLELQLAALTQHQTGSAPARPLQQAQGLLGAVPKAPGVPAQIMERLRSLAGAGPTRLGGHEKRDWALELTQNGGRCLRNPPAGAGSGRRRRTSPDDSRCFPRSYVQAAISPDAAGHSVTEAGGQVAARQPQDAIHAALSSGNDPRSSSSSGIKG